MKISLTKVKQGSISEAICTKLRAAGHEVFIPHRGWDIRTCKVDLSEFDVLINTAGITHSAAPHEWTDHRIQDVISTNLSGAITLTSKYVHDRRGKQGENTIIHIGSLWSRKHATNGAVYCASKAGLAHYIACMGYDLNLNYPDEFTIVGIHPGNVIGTPMSKKVISTIKESRPDMDTNALYAGCITPNEIADEVISCIGKKWLSGENIYLGGGDKR